MMNFQFRLLMTLISVAAAILCPPQIGSQECTHDCLVEIAGLQTQYGPNTQVKATIRNRSRESILVNVAQEGYSNGHWVEILASVIDPNHPFARMVKATPLKAGLSFSVSFDPRATLAARTKLAPFAENPTQFRLRISVHERDKLVQEVTSEPFRLIQADLLPSIRRKVYMILRNEEERMSKGKHSEVEMIGALKQMEAGRTAEDVGRELGVSKHTIYAWKAKFGGMNVSEAQRLRQLEDENHRLKKLVADLSLDKDMLKAVIAKNGWGS